MNAVVARVDGKAAACNGDVAVGMKTVVLGIQRKVAACYSEVSRRFQSLARRGGDIEAAARNGDRIARDAFIRCAEDVGAAEYRHIGVAVDTVVRVVARACHGDRIAAVAQGDVAAAVDSLAGACHFKGACRNIYHCAGNAVVARGEIVGAVENRYIGVAVDAVIGCIDNIGAACQGDVARGVDALGGACQIQSRLVNVDGAFALHAVALRVDSQIDVFAAEGDVVVGMDAVLDGGDGKHAVFNDNVVTAADAVLIAAVDIQRALALDFKSVVALNGALCVGVFCCIGGAVRHGVDSAAFKGDKSLLAAVKVNGGSVGIGEGHAVQAKLHLVVHVLFLARVDVNHAVVAAADDLPVAALGDGDNIALDGDSFTRNGNTVVAEGDNTRVFLPFITGYLSRFGCLCRFRSFCGFCRLCCLGRVGCFALDRFADRILCRNFRQIPLQNRCVIHRYIAVPVDVSSGETLALKRLGFCQIALYRRYIGDGHVAVVVHVAQQSC